MTQVNGDDAQRDELIRIIAAIAPCDAIEAGHQADALGWLRSGAGIYRLAKPDVPPKHLVVYAAIVDPAAGQLFLIRHRKARLWLPTGGHVDPGEHPFDAAKRELLEETGRRFPALSTHPLMISVDETVGDAVQPHTDAALWYTFRAHCAECLNIDPAEADGGAWFGIADLAHAQCGPQVARFMGKIGAIGAFP
jgi:8-oxo-dGTP diphosphatase